MASKLTKLAEEFSTTEIQSFTRESMEWFRNKTEDLKRPSRLASEINRESIFRSNGFFSLGKLYFFYYDALTKDQLPYWDMFPLVIPLENYKDGFLGLNLHYLPINVRSNFIQKLLPLAAADPQKNVIRLRASYEILNSVKKFHEFVPCLKKYRWDGIKSRILSVAPNEWETAVYLPVEQFKKARKNTVWKDSMKQIKKHDKKD